jgi:hypothetical protein
MTRPGDRLRRLAARVCSGRALERFVDPALSDLRIEYIAALARRQPWRARWIRCTGALRVLQVISLVSMRDGINRIGADRALWTQWLRTITLSAVATVALTALVAWMFGVFRADTDARRAIVPYMLMLAAFMTATPALALAIVWTTAAHVARKPTRRLLLATAVALSGALTIGAAWLEPRIESRGRAVDAEVFAAHPEVARSMPTYPAGPEAERRRDHLKYHSIVRTALDPIVGCLFAIALARRGRALRTAIVLAGWVAYLVSESVAREWILRHDVPPEIALATWAPIVIVLLMYRRTIRRITAEGHPITA